MRYVDTDDGDDVDLEADGDPAYYKCGDDDDDQKMPKTGDAANSLQLMAIALVSAAICTFAGRRFREGA